MDTQRKTRQTDTVSPLRTQEETDHARIVPTEDEVSVTVGDGGGGVLVLALLPFPPSLLLLPFLLLFLLLFLVLLLFFLLFLVVVRLRPVDSPQVVATFQLECCHHLRTYTALLMKTNNWSQQLGFFFKTLGVISVMLSNSDHRVNIFVYLSILKCITEHKQKTS